ncbi:MAG: hypothetical protein AABW82_05130 [Nanoarchaeota archaeon]|nr:hypothetical protein [Nanoarchaeota archaeon]
MSVKEQAKRFYKFLKEDTWQSWIISLILIVILIKFIIFPSLSFITGAPLPLVVVESCSMYHSSGFESWWNSNGVKYEQFNIDKETFSEFSFKNGINKGDIILVYGYADYNLGDVIIFLANTKNPIIHRKISERPTQTEGDNNPSQLDIEKSIPDDRLLGKAVARIPYLGWIKLIFFELSRPESQRGFCK